jgi:hypothetical protein
LEHAKVFLLSCCEISPSNTPEFVESLLSSMVFEIFDREEVALELLVALWVTIFCVEEFFRSPFE